ncbi:MAG: PAS domain S-box protein [Gemmataceae bacterium]
MRWWLGTLALAGAYAATGWLTYQLTQSADYSLPFWPPAGLAFAAVLLVGYRMVPGVWLGSLTVNLLLAAERDGRLMGAETPVAAVIAFGAAVQAFAGRWLVRRAVGPGNSLTAPRDIYAFLFIAVFGHTLVNATWSVSWLTGWGVLSLEQGMSHWWLWWLGDGNGTLLVTLFALAYFADPRSVWRARLYTTAMPVLLLTGLTVWFFFLARDWERGQIRREMETCTEQVARSLRGHVNNTWVGMQSWQTKLLQNGPEARPSILTQAATTHLNYHDQFTAITYLARVPANGTDQCIATQRRRGCPDFAIHWPAQGRKPSDNQPYSCITGVWPEPLDRQLSGLVVSALEPVGSVLHRTATANERLLLLSPVDLAGVPADQCLLFILPTYRRNLPLTTPEERQAALLGHTMGVLTLPTLTIRAGASMKHYRITVQLSGTVDAADSGDGLTWTPTGVECVRKTQLSGVNLEIRLVGGSAYLATKHFPFIWLTLLFGLCVNSLIAGVLLTITGHTAQVEGVVRRRTDELLVEIRERQDAESALRQARAELERRVLERTAELQAINERLAQEVTDRRQTEQALRESEGRLRAIVNTATDSILTITADGTIDSVNPAAEGMFGYRREELIGQNVRILMPSPFQEAHDGYLSEYQRTRVKRIIGAGREAQAIHKDGTTFPIDLAVSEVETLGLFTGIIRDITFRKQMEREVLEAATREQARIGQELHDGVGQELTGLSLTADAITQRLRRLRLAEAALTERLTDGLLRVHEQVRALSHGLVPVEVDAEGLRAALETLAGRTSDQTNVGCTFECEGQCEVADTVTATHLYRIVQEAVSNALRHARPRTIHLHWRATDDVIHLSVLDDGCGLPPFSEAEAGLGTRLMRYRASLIGGTLAITPRPEGGTRVACVVPLASTGATASRFD